MREISPFLAVPNPSRVLPGDRTSRLRPGLVRHPHRGGGGDRPDQPAGGDEPLRAEDASAPSAHHHGIPRRDAVHARRLRALRAAHRLPCDFTLAAQPDAMNERDKSYFLNRVGSEMREDLKVPDLSPRETLAI